MSILVFFKILIFRGDILDFAPQKDEYTLVSNNEFEKKLKKSCFLHGKYS